MIELNDQPPAKSPRRLQRVVVFAILILLVLTMPLNSFAAKPLMPAVETTTSPSSTPTSAPSPTATPMPTVSPTPTPVPTPEPTPTPEPPSDEYPVIALTFDDGPSNEYTANLLDMLAAEGVKATFFVGNNQIRYGAADLLTRAASEGHEIGNHTYYHRNLHRESAERIREDLTKMNEVIFQLTGQTPTLMRPPGGDYDQQVKTICAELGLSIIGWSWQSSPQDYRHKGDAGYIAQHVVEHAGNGHIVLLHDSYAASVAAVPAMIQGLKARGFRFMTVSELLASTGKGDPVAGQVYNILKD